MRMTYEDFKTEILNNKEAYLPEDLKGAEVYIEHVDKLNRSYEALMIRMPGSDVSASIPLEDFYESYKYSFFEHPYSELKDMLAGLDLEKGKMFENAGGFLKDYSAVKNNLFLRCSNAVTNADALRNCPHTSLGDLAFTAHVGLNWEEDSVPVYTAMVTDRMLKEWGISKDELLRDAIDSSEKRMPMDSGPLADLLNGMLGAEPADDYAEPDNNIYVLTNNQRQYGAAVVIYPGVLDKMYEKLGDFYMLPSSVHEFLLLSEKSGVSIEALETMVSDVNRSVLQEEEFLSDQVYHYDGKEKLMEPVRDYVKRRALTENQELSPKKPEQEKQINPFNPQTNPGMGLSM